MQRAPAPLPDQGIRPSYRLRAPIAPPPSGKPYSFALTEPVALVVAPFQGNQRQFLNVRLWNTGQQVLQYAQGSPSLYITGSCSATGAATAASAPGFGSVSWSVLNPGQYADIRLLGGYAGDYPDTAYRVTCSLNLMRKEGNRFVENLHSVSSAWILANSVGGVADVRIAATVKRYGTAALTTQDDIVVITTLTTAGGWQYRDPVGVECALSRGASVIARRSQTSPGPSRDFPKSIPFAFGKLAAGSYSADCSVTANDLDTTNNAARHAFSIRAPQ